MSDLKQPHPTDVVVGGRVRSARLARNMSQATLADRIGVTFQQVQKYENGSNRISASKLVEIADTLTVSASGFLEGLGAYSERGAPALAADGAHDVLVLYTSLPPPMREAVLQLAQQLVRAAGTQPAPTTRSRSGRATRR